MHLNWETLHVEKYAYHLGHPIGNENVNNALDDSVWRTNDVMTIFGSRTADIRSFMDLHYGVWVHLIKLDYMLHVRC